MIEQALELKKHVGVIHCSNTISLLQRKISNALLFRAYDDLLVKEEHEISMGELRNLIGYKSNDYDTIKRAIKSLISTLLEWNLLNDRLQRCDDREEGRAVTRKTWHASTMLASAKIDGPICTYSYSPELRKLLYLPEMYAKINLLIQARFKSSYALALYENCVRYRNLQYTRWFTIELFRKLMGIPDNQYPLFKDMKRKAVDKAVMEINEHSDILLDYETRRVSQKVVAIRFRVGKKNTAIQPVKCIDNKQATTTKKQNTLTTNGNKILTTLLANNFRLSQKQIETIIKNYEPRYIESKIKLVKMSTSYREGNIRNLAAFFISSLKNDYQPQQTSQQIIPKANEKEIEKERQKKRREKQQQDDYKVYIEEALNCFIRNMNDTFRVEIEDAFEEHMKSIHLASVKKRYNLVGIDPADKVIMAFYRNFIRSNYSDAVNIMEFSDFVKKSD